MKGGKVFCLMTEVYLSVGEQERDWSHGKTSERDWIDPEKNNLGIL